MPNFSLKVSHTLNSAKKILYRPIHSVLILVSNKSLLDYKPNWTPLSSVAITNHRYRYFYHYYHYHCYP